MHNMSPNTLFNKHVRPVLVTIDNGKSLIVRDSNNRRRAISVAFDEALQQAAPPDQPPLRYAWTIDKQPSYKGAKGHPS